MQLPFVDRQPGLAPIGSDQAVPSVGRVIPVAPVNPPQADAVPGVVNKIGNGPGALMPAAISYSGIESATRPAPGVMAGDADWTIKNPPREKVEVPAPEPISKQLLDFLQAVWRASGSAVEIAQAQNQLLHNVQNNPAAAPGRLAKEELTYQSSKIRKNEKL